MLLCDCQSFIVEQSWAFPGVSRTVEVTYLLQVDILWFFIVSVVLVAVTADVSSTEPQNINLQVNVDSYW